MAAPLISTQITVVSVHFSSVFTAMLSAFWAYQGWASVGFVGGEIKDAKRNIPLGIGAGGVTGNCSVPAGEYHLPFITDSAGFNGA